MDIYIKVKRPLTLTHPATVRNGRLRSQASSWRQGITQAKKPPLTELNLLDKVLFQSL
ncbi:MAG: hypothetical protein KME08_00780 [Aphanothece sp. CMT-3BRIN-NPC111]|nr:hypothetical protein [Aphanothece sp. CMT-3BRIN-NPC111]